MVTDHWSNDAMVSMDRCGLVHKEQRSVSRKTRLELSILSFELVEMICFLPKLARSAA